MIVSIIVAMDENGGIGIDNKLPWHLADDLKRFKRLTIGHYLIVGRKTFETIGKVLPGRKMIVLTKDKQYNIEGVKIFTNLEDAIQFVKEQGEDEVFIAGGGQVYQLAIPYIDKMYLTLVHAKTNANVFFPNIDWEDWIEIESLYHERDEKNQYDFTFKILQKKRRNFG
ncbi:MAG: dihydrofolate reductase [Anaerolineales bacterium]